MSRGLPVSLVLLAATAGCSTPVWEVPRADPPPADWVRVARVAGAPLDVEDDEAEWTAWLDRAVRAHVIVVAADSSLSAYPDYDRFQRELDLMRRFTTLAHDRNLKVLWYFPSLEVITPDGETLDHSMFKDHPDWVQLGLDETPCDASMTPKGYSPNVFYGSKAFWVDPGAESAWMCHLSPWRDVYLDRVKRIAETGVDGLWLDVPLFNDIVGRWACHHERDRRKFEADTGRPYPRPICRAEGEPPVLDPTDPSFRVWVQWRHREIDAFLKEVHGAARSVMPDFQLVVETVTMDYNAAMLEGLDGAFAGPLEGFSHVWEVDVLSDSHGMRFGRLNDWYSLLAMYEFGRGADAGRGAWAFTYGLLPDDAEAVMMTAAASQVNPYELKVPEMTSTVGWDYRERVFGWLKDHQDDLYRSRSAARVAILHSSSSRDSLDSLCLSDWEDTGACGVSLFDRWDRPEGVPAWWTDDADDSVQNSLYLSEYRGLVRLLSEIHVPFDVRPSRLLDAAQASAYDVLVAPNLLALSDGEAGVLRAFVEEGGTLVLTGDQGRPGSQDEHGLPRPQPVLPAPTGNPGIGQPVRDALGAGHLVFLAGSPGRDVLTQASSAAARREEMATLLARHAGPTVRTEASADLHLDLYRTDRGWALHVLRMGGGDGEYSITRASAPVEVFVGDETVRQVLRTSARDPVPVEIPFQAREGWVRFQADVDIHALFLVVSR